MGQKKHDWAPLRHFLDIHDKILRFHHRYMETPRSYDLDWKNPNYLIMRCERVYLTTYKGTRIRVDITKEILVDDAIPNRPKALTYDYTYSASVPGGDTLFRYCSPHHDRDNPKSPDHHKFHHKHDFSGATEKVIRVEADEQPHVGEFLKEVLTNL